MIKPALEIGNGNWGAKDSSLLGYAHGDTIDKFIRRQLAFERGTNIGATRTNKDGLIEKGRENLLDYSNSFDKWADTSGASAYTLTNGYPGYDGSNDAWLMEKTAGNNSYLYFQNNTVNTGSNNLVWCYSIYAKAADNDSGILMYVGDSSSKGYIRVNLNDGSVTNKDGSRTKGYKIEGVTGEAGDRNRWWRISFFSTENVNDKPRLQPRNAAGDSMSSGNVYVMNAQFEYGTAPSEYIRTESRKNLLKNSEHFHDRIHNATVTRNVLGYDGSLDAVKMDKTATYGRVQWRVDAGVSNNDGWVGLTKGTLTLSAYAKQDSLSGLHMRVDYSTTQGDFEVTNFDLGNVKPVGTQADWLDSRKAEDVGNGWVRCSITFTTTRPVYEINLYGHRIKDDLSSTFDDPNNDGTPPQTGSIFIQHVQLEHGTEATAYEGTSSYAGLLEDQPRIDYADTDPHLLMEPTRANLHLHSEYRLSGNFYNVDETYGFKSPDGSNNAIKIQADSSDTGHFVVNGMVSVTSDEEYTASVFVKAGNNISDVKFGIADQQATANFAYAYFDITGDGTVGATHEGGTGSLVSKTIKKVGTDGWYRVSVTATITDTSIKSVLFMSDDGSDPVGFQDSTANMYVYGWQFEEGSFATSYIPTYGVSVTRSNEGIPLKASGVVDMDDDFGVTGDDITIFVDLAENPSLSRDNSSGGIRLSDGDNQSGAFRLYRNNTTTDLAVVFFGTSADSFGAGKNSASVSLPSSATKVAVTRVRSTGVFTIYCDGSPLDEGLTDANGQFTNSYFDTSWDKLQLTGQGSNIKYNGIKFFDEALSADDLATLTS